MTTNISAYLGNKVVRWVAGNAMPSAPSNTYWALFLSGSEVTTTIRVAGRVAATWTAPASGSTTTMSTSADADFGAAAGGSNVDEVRLYDAASSGNLLFSKTFGAVTVSAGESVKILSGDATIDVS